MAGAGIQARDRVGAGQERVVGALRRIEREVVARRRGRGRPRPGVLHRVRHRERARRARGRAPIGLVAIAVGTRFGERSSTCTVVVSDDLAPVLRPRADEEGLGSGRVARKYQVAVPAELRGRGCRASACPSAAVKRHRRRRPGASSRCRAASRPAAATIRSDLDARRHVGLGRRRASSPGRWSRRRARRRSRHEGRHGSGVGSPRMTVAAMP